MRPELAIISCCRTEVRGGRDLARILLLQCSATGTLLLRSHIRTGVLLQYVHMVQMHAGIKLLTTRLIDHTKQRSNEEIFTVHSYIYLDGSAL